MEDIEIKIQFSGLKDGEHHFEFIIGQTFFSSFGSDLLNKGRVKVNVVFTKKPTHFELGFKLTGTVDSVCDRCLVSYDQPIDTEERIYIKLGDTHEELSDEIVVIPRSDFEIDAGQWVYEIIQTRIPMKKVACEILKDSSICDEAVRDRMEDTQEEKDNPIWDALKELNKEKLN